MAQGRRIEALDVLRGFTVSLMIMVNNAGDSYAFMHHSEWNGLTLSDIVFPFFLFIMGASTYLSLSKSGFKADKETIVHIIIRSSLIILISWTIFWFGRVLKGDFLPFDHFRFTGVLTRIAIVYCLLSVLAITLNHKIFPYLAAALLSFYTILLMIGNGYSNDSSSIVARTDVLLLGHNHIYSKAPIDPEGLLASIPSLAHGIIGFMCGKLLRSNIGIRGKIKRMSLVGIILTVSGLILSLWLPLNKRIWSPSFVLVTTGLAEMSLAALTFIIDEKKHSGFAAFRFFKVFGMNALFIYALSEMLHLIFSATGIAGCCTDFLRNTVSSVELADFLYSLLFMLLLFFFGLFLHKRKIFIKI